MPDIFVAQKENNSSENKDTVKSDLKMEKCHKYNLSRTRNPFAAFSAYPDGVRFETQEEEEEIILLLRKHIITNVFWVLAAILLFFAGSFVFPLFHYLFPVTVPLNFQIVGTIIWYLLVITFIITKFLGWYYNVFIVTNERIVDVDYYNLTYKQIASAPLEKVQDVTIKSGGVIRTIFDFADIHIQTAGTEDNITFEAVPKPDLIARQILELTEKDNNSV